jgi:hypothetical protein
MATTLVAVAQKKEMIEPLFSAEVYGARLARALDALAALEACVRADLLRGPVAPETAPFVRPHQGSLYLAVGSMRVQDDDRLPVERPWSVALPADSGSPCQCQD